MQVVRVGIVCFEEAEQQEACRQEKRRRSGGLYLTIHLGDHK